MTRSQLVDPAYANGWDHPPEVTSPNCHLRSHWKTSQRLFTLDSNKTTNPQQDEGQANEFIAGSLLCAPIVVYERWIVVASGMKISVFGNFENEDQFDDSSQRRISTTATPPLAQFSLCSDNEELSLDWNDKIIQLSFHEETGILYVLSVESCIFQVKLILSIYMPAISRTSATNLDSRKKEIIFDDSGGDSGSSVVTTAPTPLKFSLVHSWVTEKLRVTCMATLHNGGGIGIDTICVGYKSGHIEAWNVHHPPLDRSGEWAKQQKINQKDVSLQWEGYMHDSIRTLSFLFRGNELQKETLAEGLDKVSGTATLQINEEKSNTTKEHYLVAVVAISTRAVDKRKQQSTSSMLKILDLERIMNETTKTADSINSDVEISLQKYTLPQSRGTELIDATNILPLSKDRRLPKRVPILESHGADAACILNTAPSGAGKNQNSCAGISLPDGTIALLSHNQDESDATGVASCDKQVLLSFPAIGSGQLNMIDENGEFSNYLVACLRGGTCYLIPTSEASDKNNSIATISFAHDIESDFSDVYVQAFTAGNLMVDKGILPVLIYAWPGGIVDVYSCGLVPSKATETNELTKVNKTDGNLVVRAERRALQDLIENDSLLLLSKILDELRTDSRHPLLQTKEWEDFLEETKHSKVTSVENIAIDALCSIKYQSLHRILLSLALTGE